MELCDQMDLRIHIFEGDCSLMSNNCRLTLTSSFQSLFSS